MRFNIIAPWRESEEIMDTFENEPFRPAQAAMLGPVNRGGILRIRWIQRASFPLH
jgi:hypothetical protein